MLLRPELAREDVVGRGVLRFQTMMVRVYSMTRVPCWL